MSNLPSEGVFDAGKVGYASVDGLEKVEHGEVGAVEGWYVVEVEGQIGGTAGYLLAVLYKLLNTCHLGKGGSHGASAPCAYLLGVLCQAAAALDAGAAHVYDYLEVSRHSLYPGFGQQHALLLGEHVALARRAVDEHAFQPVAGQEVGIGGYGLVVYLAVGVEGGERRIY